MAAEGEMEKELSVHQKGYDRFVTLFRVGAAICMVVALLVILIIRK